MASIITTTGFNESFPEAGADNDSQGFRTNFNVTKVALEQAKTEITTLQSDTAKLNADNDFNGSKIQEAELLKNTETVYANGNVAASQNVSWEFGHYQTIQVGADVTLTLADWPASSKMGRLRLQITSDGSAPRTITWASAGGGSFKTADGFTKTITITDPALSGGTSSVSATFGEWPATFTVDSQTNPIIVDFWTINGGTTVFAKYHGVFT